MVIQERVVKKIEQQIASVCRKVARKYAELDEKSNKH